jgi:hypothetical protein
MACCTSACIPYLYPLLLVCVATPTTYIGARSRRALSLMSHQAHPALPPGCDLPSHPTAVTARWPYTCTAATCKHRDRPAVWTTEPPWLQHTCCVHHQNPFASYDHIAPLNQGKPLRKGTHFCRRLAGMLASRAASTSARLYLAGGCGVCVCGRGGGGGGGEGGRGKCQNRRRWCVGGGVEEGAGVRARGGGEAGCQRRR